MYFRMALVSGKVRRLSLLEGPGFADPGVFSSVPLERRRRAPRGLGENAIGIRRRHVVGVRRIWDDAHFVFRDVEPVSK